MNLIPKIYDNPLGWGPSEEFPQGFSDLPYTPFNKGDKIGKISDWSYQQRTQGRDKYVGMGGFSYRQDDDELSFRLVDNRPGKGINRTQKKWTVGNWKERKRGTQVKSKWEQRVQTNAAARGQTGTRGRKRQQPAKNRQDRRNKYGNWGYYKQQKTRLPSVEINEDWKIQEEVTFSVLFKNPISNTPSVKELTSCGTLCNFDTKYDFVTVKNDITLKPFHRRKRFITTPSEDPIIQRFAEKKAAQFYASDKLLSLIMVAHKGAYSWDIIVTKNDDGIFLDYRKKSKIDCLTVNETGHEPSFDDPSSINHPNKLSEEATFIDHCFSQQVLNSSNPKILKEKDPFISNIPDNFEPSIIGFTYRKWTLDDDISIITRCDLHSYTTKKNQEINLAVHALNEFDNSISGGLDWRQCLDNRKGAVMATELKNNAFKIAQWTIQAVLAGCSEIRFGFISRIQPKDNKQHIILGVHRYSLEEFITQTALNLSTSWEALKKILVLCKKQENGTYLLVRDPNEEKLTLLQIPSDAFDKENEPVSIEEDIKELL